MVTTVTTGRLYRIYERYDVLYEQGMLPFYRTAGGESFQRSKFADGLA